MSLALEDFIQRLLLHVPVPHTQVVRSYGLYHPSQSASLALRRAQLGQPAAAVPQRLDWQTVCADRGEAHPERCPRCGRLLVCTAIFHRGGVPPPALLVGEVA